MSRALPRPIRWVLVGLMGAVALAAFVVGGCLTLARTSWGAERIRRFALPRVNAMLAGRIDVGKFAFSGDRIVLRDVTLRDPDGDLVARVARVDVWFRPWALLRQHVDLRAVTLDEPWLLLRQGRTGDLNLTRTLMPRSPAPVDPGGIDDDGGGSGPRVHLASLEIRAGSVEFQDEGTAVAPPLRHSRIVDLNTRASGHYDAGRFEMRVDARGEATAPLQAPVNLVVTAGGVRRARGLDAHADIDVQVGDNGLRATARVASLPETPTPGVQGLAVQANLDIERVRVDPSFVRLFVPGSPLKAAATLSGRASWDGATKRATAEIDLAAAGAKVAVMAVTASVNPPRHSIETLVVRATGIDFSRLFDQAPPSDLSFELDGKGWGSTLANVQGTASLHVPPGRLGGHPIGPIRLRAETDAGRHKVLELLAVLPGVDIKGGGEATPGALTFRAAANLRDLGATVSSAMSGRESRAPRAAGRGRIDIAVGGNPLAPSLRVSGRLVALAWQDLRVPVVDLSAFLPNVHRPLAATVNLKVPAATIGARKVRDLVVALETKGSRFDARVSLTAPEAVHLAVAGTLSRASRDQRVSGRVDLAVLGARLNGDFNLPVAWPPPPRSSVRADLTVANIDLHRIVTTLRRLRGPTIEDAVPTPVAGAPITPRGIASLRLTMAGTGASPELRVEAEARQLKVGSVAVGDVVMTVDAPGTKPIAVRVELRHAAGGILPPAAAPGVVLARTEYSLAALLHRPPTRAQLLTTPMHVEAHLDRMALAPLATLSSTPRSVAGTASLDILLDGTPSSIKGRVALVFAGVRSRDFPTTDGRLHVDLGERDLRADAHVTRRGVTLLAVRSRIDAPIRRLGNPAALVDVPIEAHVVLGPLELQRSGLAPSTDRQPPRILKGRVRVQADVTGTLRSPHLDVRADAADIRIDQTPIGSGTVAVTYADRKAAGDVVLVSANAGRLHLVASTSADLGYPAIARGVDPRRMAIKARLDAKGFDLSGLSGITPGVRSVAGQLFAAIELTGTAADPRVAGRAEWKGGGLTITGRGEYKNIHLLARGDKDHIVLEELRADSGAGHARVTASGDHHAGSGYAVKAAVKLHEFPAYVEGQALATVSLQASADVRLSVQQIRAKATIGAARVRLTDAKRKHLQPMARPVDVVLIEAGSPLNPAQAQKLAALNAALAGSPADNPGLGSPRARPGVRAGPPGVILLVDAPRNLWVNGDDANVELGLQPGFRVEITDTTRVYGTVTVKRGRVNVVGRRFDLKADSSVRFGGPPDAPELAVNAKHVNDREKITVLIAVRGRPGNLQIAISAPDRPDLTESQLYTLIVTGRQTFGGGTASASTPTDQAASLLGGLVAARLQKGLAKKVPFDVLTIEAGQSAGAARLEAGRYVTSDLYVGYVGRLGADPARQQNRNAVHLEYELGSRWSFQGEYGDAKTGSADVVRTTRY